MGAFTACSRRSRRPGDTGNARSLGFPPMFPRSHPFPPEMEKAGTRTQTASPRACFAGVGIRLQRSAVAFLARLARASASAAGDTTAAEAGAGAAHAVTCDAHSSSAAARSGRKVPFW